MHRKLLLLLTLAALALPASAKAYQCAVSNTTGAIQQCGINPGAPTGSTVYDFNPSTSQAIATVAAGPNNGITISGLNGPDVNNQYSGTPTAQATATPVPTPAAGVVLGPAMGTSPPSIIFTAGSDWTRGDIQFGTGTSPTTGILWTATYPSSITFAKSPVVLITGMTAATMNLGLYVSSRSTTGAVISAAVAPTASKTAGFYQFEYYIVP